MRKIVSSLCVRKKQNIRFNSKTNRDAQKNFHGRFMMEAKMFNDLMESVGEAKDILERKKQPSRSFIIDEPDAKSIRTQMQLTQDEFAGLLNISVYTLRNWEQLRRNVHHSSNDFTRLEELVSKHSFIKLAKTIIRQRADYANFLEAGTTVVETSKEKDGKAAKEIQALYKEIKEVING